MEYHGREERRIPFKPQVVIDAPPPAAISPAEAAKLNDSADVAAFHAAIIKINEKLKREYRTGGTVQISDSLVGSGKVGEKVLAHFAAAGWKTKYESVNDPREYYAYYEFRA